MLKIADEISLDGKLIVITGANQGIGYETALELARRGPTIVLACRDRTRAQEAQEKIKKEANNNKIEIEDLDLGDLASVRAFADRFKAKWDRLDILINNAGFISDKYLKTKDGFEMHLGVNHLGHFLLTNLLLDVIKKSAPSRIVNVASLAYRTGKIYWDDINLEKSFSALSGYGQSKLGNVLFTIELAKKLEGSGVTTVCLHPGFVNTNILNNNKSVLGYIIKGLAQVFAKNTDKGAATSVHCAISGSVINYPGQYFNDSKPQKLYEGNTSGDDAKRFWELSVQMVGLNSEIEKQN